MSQKKYCLAATALTEFWDTSLPLVILGDWCIQENQNRLHEIEYYVLPNPYKNQPGVDELHAYFNDIEMRLLPLFVDMLNDMHQESRTEIYWGYVLNSWMKHFLMICYDRYLYLREAREGWGDLILYGVPFSDNFIPIDTLDFIKLAWTDLFNHILFTEFAQLMNINTIFTNTISYKKPVSQKKTHISFKNIIRYKSYYYYCRGRTIQKRFIHGVPEIYIYSSSFDSEFKSKLFRKNPDIGEILMIPGLSPEYNMIKDNKRDLIKEKLARNFRASNEYEKILVQLLPHYIPSCYLENYQDLKRFTHTWFNMKKTPKAIFTSYGFWFDEPYKMWAGHHAEQGSCILHAEHSTNGVIKYGGWYIEKERCNACYTWGWNDPEEKKVIPKSAPLFIKKEKMNACNSKIPILFVLTLPSRYVIRLGDPVIHSEEYTKRQLEFLSEFPKELLDSVIVRHYPNSFGSDTCKNNILAEFPDLSFDNWELPFKEQLKRCRIFVSDHLSTTYLEALNANKPTILISDPTSEICRDTAKPYLDLLIESGILFYSPKEAARALVKAYPDVEMWWNEPKRQDAVQKFCRTFLYVSDDPVREWSEEFRKYL